MKRYAIGILSFFENENKVFIVEAKDKVNAMIKGLIEFNTPKNNEEKIDKDTLSWIQDMRIKSVQKIQEECFDEEIAISEPIEI